MEARHIEFTADEFDEIDTLENFPDALAEFIDGEVVVMAPESGAHYTTKAFVLKFLAHRFHADVDLFVVPEVRIASVDGRERFRADVALYRKDTLEDLNGHPLITSPLLIVEVLGKGGSAAMDFVYKREKYLALPSQPIYVVFDIRVDPIQGTLFDKQETHEYEGLDSTLDAAVSRLLDQGSS